VHCNASELASRKTPSMQRQHAVATGVVVKGAKERGGQECPWAGLLQGRICQSCPQ